MGDRIREGRRGERAAERYLMRRGWLVLARNWRGPGGELDLVVARRGVLMACEVKARADPAALVEPVRPGQARRVVATAARFAAARGLEALPRRVVLVTVDLGRIPVRVRVAHDLPPLPDPGPGDRGAA